MKPELRIIEAAELLAAAAVAGAEPQGWAWDVIVLRPGLSKIIDAETKLPIHFSREFARAAASAYEGARVFVNHEYNRPTPEVQHLIGYIENARVLDDGAIGGTLRLLESEDWIRQKLQAAAKAGRLNLFGLSIVSYISHKRTTVDGREVLDAREVLRNLPISVDLVTYPAAGGELLRAVASQVVNQPPQQIQSSERRSEGALAKMKERILKLLASLRRMFSGNPVIAEIEAELNKETPDLDGAMDKATQLLASVQTPTQAAAAAAAASPPGVEPSRVTELERRVEAAETRQRAAESRLLLNTMLDSSRLPEPLQADIRRRFADQAPTAEQITAEITAVRAAYAAVVPNPTRISGAPVVSMGLTSYDKMSAALDRMMGVTHAWNEERDGQVIRMVRGAEVDKSVPAFKSIKAAYIEFTGDTDVRFVLGDDYFRRVRMDWNNAGFPNALAATLHRLLLQDYNEVQYGVEQFIKATSVPDFKNQERVRIGYLGDLATVNPENAAYAKIVAPTDEKETYAVIQKGNIMPITRKMIKNDDIGAVEAFVRRLGRAARRTLAQYITDFFVNNPALNDGDAWFHANHSNLGSTALAIAELEAIRTAFRNFTEKNSAKKLGLYPKFLMIPPGLEGAAISVNKREYTDANFTPNTVQWLFGQPSQASALPPRVIVNHLLADATDYYVLGDPNDAPYLEIGFLDGRREPEFFLADNPLAGAAFTNDEIQYKVRYEFGGAPVDFRNVYKEVVA